MAARGGATDKNSPLRGTGILVTRPEHQAQELCRRIRAAGGNPYLFPVIEISEPRDPDAARAVIDRFGEFDIAVFVSANAVHHAWKLLEAAGGFPAGLRVAAVGRATARVLEGLGRSPDIVPERRFSSEGLLELPALQQVRDLKVVIVCGEGGRETLSDELARRGARVTRAEVYRRIRPDTDPGPLLQQWVRGAIDVVIVTSNTALRNLYGMLEGQGRGLLLRTPLVVISDRSAALAKELGFQHTPVIAPVASDAGLVEAVHHWLVQKAPSGKC